MWIVALALRRPYTFVVCAIVLVLLTPLVLLRTPTDIFPNIDIPVISVIWQYAGLDAQGIEQRLVYNHERAMTATVNDVEHIESTSYTGVGVIKVFLQPGASVDAGVAQTELFSCHFALAAYYSSLTINSQKKCDTSVMGSEETGSVLTASFPHKSDALGKNVFMPQLLPSRPGFFLLDPFTGD